MSRAEPVEAATALVEALRGPESDLRDLLSGSTGPGHAVLREAARLVEAATADPVGFAATHGDPVWHRLRTDAAGLERLRRVFRRDEALEALYATDQSGGVPESGELSDAAAELAEGVLGDLAALDAAIGAAAEGWRVERMAPVDRNVIRLGLWELRHRPDTPVAVVISEAVRLAKAYSTENSGRFVNGVLAALAAAERPEG
jgi:transcription antitermination factor NusB